MKKDNSVADKTNKPNEKIPSKQKILVQAANLFAAKGYTETSIRELALVVGMKGSSIYNHFPSKNAILEYMLNDYWIMNTGIFKEKDYFLTLKNNPTSDGILDCLVLSFPEGKEEYYGKLLCVILQEQHRNPIIRKFVAEEMILFAENNFKSVTTALIELNIIRHDTDPDFWAEMVSGIFYAFANRMMLGICDGIPEPTDISMSDMLKSLFAAIRRMLKSLFDMMFNECGIQN